VLARQLIEHGQLIGQAFGFTIKVRHGSGELALQPFLLDLQLLAAFFDLPSDCRLIGMLPNLIDCPVPKGSRLTAGVPISLQFFIPKPQLLLHRGCCQGWLNEKPAKCIARVVLCGCHQTTLPR
jgi:hypothetical protein